MLPVQTKRTRFIRWSAHRDTFAQRNELLRCGGVNTDGGVELRLGRADLDRDGDALDHLACVGADHVRADDFLARAVDEELHERALLVFAERELERAERRLVHIHGAELLARALFRKSYRG